MREDRLGCTGHEEARTPVLDELAAEGALFDHCIVSAPITLPSHATMLTGMLPHEMEVRNNRPYSVSKEADTLAEKLKRKGYRTRAVVAGEPLAPGCGLEQGFDSYTFLPTQQDVKALLQEAPADRVTDLAIEALDSVETGKPFFYWIHYFDPHFPYAPPRRFQDMGLEPYDGEVAFVDEQIGRLLGALKRKGLFDKMLITVLSDHGEGLGEHGEPTHAFFLYDTTIKVPLLIHGPMIENKGLCKSQVRTMDLMDTLLIILDGDGASTTSSSAGDASHPSASEAWALATYLKTANAPPPVPKPAFTESLYCYQSFRWAQLTALRTPGRKLIRGARDEGYDLLNDPGEERAQETTTRDTSDAGDRDSRRPGNPDPGQPVSSWDELIRRMDELKAGAKSMISGGRVFQQELPGYFGGGFDEADSVFLSEKRNRALPHPMDRKDLIRRLLEAVAVSGAGGLNGARRELRSVIEEDPGNPTALFWLGRVTRELGEKEGNAALLEEAHGFFKKTLEIDPGNGDAFHMGVWCLIQLGAFEDALDALKKWTRGRETGAKDLELYGYLYSARISAGKVNPLHDAKKGFEYFDRALALNANDRKLLDELIEMCRVQGDTKRGERYAKRLDALEKDGWQRSP